MNRRLCGWIIVALAAFTSVGCVSQREADDLQTLYRRSQEQVEELRARLEECQARARALESATRQDPALLEQLEAALAQRDQLAQALSGAEQQLRELGAGEALPPELNAALVDLAAQYPDLMTYDPDRGLIKLRSDLTFALGSADVNPTASESLGRLAQIIGRPMAEAYEVRIVGHTDAVPISRPATRQKHPTNWHLSVHRAISVKDVIEEAGVAPARMGVAGYGPYRPVVPNQTADGGKVQGAEANRRVEIFLVPRTMARVDAPAPAADEAGADQPAEDTTPAAQESAATPNFNK